MSSRLPQPVGRQKEVLCLPAYGHTVVLGTAGSGKTTMAIHRAVYLANPGTDHHGRTLLVTFNRCLVAYLESLAGSIPRGVEVWNYHRFARGYLTHRDRMRWNTICDSDLRKGLCAQAVIEAKAAGVTNVVFDRPVEFLVEEFRWLAKHGITTTADYHQADRVGRAGTRIARTDRSAVMDIYGRYKVLRSNAGKDYDWDDLAHGVLEEFGVDNDQRYYRHIVIDEGQDFSPMMLRSLAAAIPTDGSLSFFGDMAQQIYGNRMSWRGAGLNVGSRDIWHFEENYRNTKQIARLALAIAEMPDFPDDPDLVEPKSPSADGPLPALISFSAEAGEIAFVAERARRLSQTQTVAVLFRDRDQEDTLESLVSGEATKLHREMGHWPPGPGLFYGTYHSAKGLEFDAVFLPYLSNTRLPYPPDRVAFGERDAAARDSRLLYVAVTRAKSTLILTYSLQPTPLLPSGESLYQRSRR